MCLLNRTSLAESEENVYGMDNLTKPVAQLWSVEAAELATIHRSLVIAPEEQSS